MIYLSILSPVASKNLVADRGMRDDDSLALRRTWRLCHAQAVVADRACDNVDWLALRTGNWCLYHAQALVADRGM